jgi:CHAT domain-containing protein
MLGVHHCAAIALSIGICVTCAPKPKEALPLPADPEGLHALISEVRHSDPLRATKLADQANTKPKATISPIWQWRLRLLQAELLLDQAGGSKAPIPTATQLLSSPTPPDVSLAEAAARIASVRGYIAQVQSQFQTAEGFYETALANISFVIDPCWRAELLVHHRASTLRHLARFTEAEVSLNQASVDVKACPDRYWETAVPLVEGNSFNDQFYYENAVASFERSRGLATVYKFPQLVGLSLGNMALCYYNLGDWDNALRTFDRTDDFYKSLAHPSGKELKDLGMHKGHRARTYLASGQYDEAARAYQEAIEIATQVGDEPFLARWQTELTSLYIETGDYQSARKLNQQALDHTGFETDFPAAAAARLNAARLDRLEGNLPEAQEELAKVEKALDEHRSQRDPKLVWQLHRERAEVLAGMKRVPQARREFETALATADLARSSIRADEYRLTFFLPLRNLYQSYVSFLAAQNQPVEALRVAESGHARLLAEKLNETSRPSPAVDFTRIARVKDAVILSYMTAPDGSYMWVTTAAFTRMFRLPPEGTLRKLIRRHNEPILEERPLSEDQEGRTLYETLIGPAASLIPPGSNVIVVPDGPLSDLNFETLIPPAPTPHYWVESAIISVAPSLTLLVAKHEGAFSPESVLAAGNAVQADPNLPQLGDEELQVLNKTYGSRCTLLKGAAATPANFIQAHPERYSLIHLSAHAIPNPESPLNSYFVLSPGTDDGYKLYAHDLAKLQLGANLVILSACQSTGKNVPGEGLVGLSWAVLRAGAHNVIASLWPVAASATAGLMSSFYSHLNAGESPSRALHSAKLDLTKTPGSTPYEWAAFQVYSR